MELLNDGMIAFDFYFPMYNWLYPFSFNKIEGELEEKMKKDSFSIFEVVGNSPVKRALYFHVPFCEGSLCSFCPLNRELCMDEKKLDLYVAALEKEIQIKSKYSNITGFPIESIYFGGGTPSILRERHIRRIGNIIKETFDLSELKEFSFEMNAKSVTYERVAALKEIGVTHARMGVQTFNSKYREIFNMAATLDEVKKAVALLNENFQYVSIDVLYGMHGQTIDEFLTDLHHVIGLNTSNLDIYPINNVSIQTKLYESYKKNNMKPNSGMTKFAKNVLLREYMRQNGYLPHNGHGYFKVGKEIAAANPVITDKYHYHYHEALYGYKGHEVIGFGCSAYSSFDGYILGNCSNIDDYIDGLLNKNTLKIKAAEYDKELCEGKGLILHLSYYGVAEKSKLNLDLIDEKLLSKLDKLIENGLVVEDEKTFRLTQTGWYWYTNIIFFLSHSSDQEKLLNHIKKNTLDERRELEDWFIRLDESN